SAESMTRNVSENFRQTAGIVERYLRREEAEEIARRHTEFLGTHAAGFERRIAEGRVRDCHGDLRLEHVYMRPGEKPVVIDCIEFNDRFRFGDTCSDIAF